MKWSALLVLGLSFLLTSHVRADEPSAGSVASPNRDGESLDPTSLFKDAVGALKSEQPATAIAKFEALGDQGIIDPVLSYDRGLAYAARVRARAELPGDLGRAVHGFEEAREISRDKALIDDATTALAAVRGEVSRRRSRAGDPIEMDHGLSLERSIVKLLPENVWAALAGLASLGLVVGIVLRARATRKRLKVAGTTTCAVAGGLLALTAIILHSARDVRLHMRDAIVIAPNVRLLDAKHLAIPSVSALAEGMRVQLLDESGDFAHVIWGHTEGWLLSSTILPLAKSP